MGTREHILAVDDNPTNLIILEETLKDFYEVTTASSGEDALEIAVNLHPDLVLLDIMMPGIDGYETCHRLRACPELADVRIIMVSAKAMTRERLMAYDSGADDYLTKPFAPAELLSKVRVHLELCSMGEMKQLKGDVLTLLEHETSTPLNGVLAGASLLKSAETMDDDDRRQLGEVIESAALRLHRFLGNVVLLSALRSHNWELHREQKDLAELALGAARDAMSQAAIREIAIVTESDGKTMVEIDHTEMERVVSSMLDNAIRFSPYNSVVTIKVTQADGVISLSVSDQGEGIDEEALPHVLDPFGRTRANHHSQGAGLSLAIAEEIVQQHGGEIQASNCPNGGAIFKIILPSAMAA